MQQIYQMKYGVDLYIENENDNNCDVRLVSFSNCYNDRVKICAVFEFIFVETVFVTATLCASLKLLRPVIHKSEDVLNRVKIYFVFLYQTTSKNKP